MLQFAKQKFITLRMRQLRDRRLGLWSLSGRHSREFPKYGFVFVLANNNKLGGIVGASAETRIRGRRPTPCVRRWIQRDELTTRSSERDKIVSLITDPLQSVLAL